MIIKPKPANVLTVQGKDLEKYTIGALSMSGDSYGKLDKICSSDIESLKNALNKV